MASITIYNRPSRAPSGIEGIIDALNASNGQLSFNVSTYPIRTGFVRVFAGENGDEITSVTPDPDISISWHRSRVDTTQTVIVRVAEITQDHRGRFKPVVTGWLLGEDGKHRPFCATPLTPRNPGGYTAYNQNDELAIQFVEAAQKVMGSSAEMEQHGMSCSMPVKAGTGRNAPSFQPTGLTVARLLDSDGAVLYDGNAMEFKPDPEGQEMPPLQKRTTLRIRGRDYWAPLTEELTVYGNNVGVGADVDAFLAELTS